MFKKILWGVLAPLIFLACSTQNAEYFLEKGEAQQRALIKELHRIHSFNELEQAAPKLKKKFNALIHLMIQAREVQKKHPEYFLSVEPQLLEFRMSDRLRTELQRLYKLPGCRELVESCQREALMQLDKYEKQR